VNLFVRLILVCFLLLFSLAFAQSSRSPAGDRQALIDLEQQWLHAHDAASLDRILASDFVHVIPADHFRPSMSTSIGR